MNKTMKEMLVAARTVAVTGMVLMPALAMGHASLEQDEAIAGSGYRGVMRITHGCNGSPTVTVRMRIPSGLQRTKPMAKPGWMIDIVVDKLDEPYDYHGNTVTEDVVELTWRGGSLPDEQYDEFVFRTTLPDAHEEKILYFPTVQECANGETHRWIEIPEAGQEPDDMEAPAPSLKLIPEEEGHHH